MKEMKFISELNLSKKQIKMAEAIFKKRLKKVKKAIKKSQKQTKQMLSVSLLLEQAKTQAAKK